MRGVAKGVRGRLWSPRAPVDMLLTGAGCAATVGLVLGVLLGGSGPSGATPVLLVVTAVAAVAAAVLAEVAGRLAEDARWSWTAAALAVQGGVVLPVTALAADGAAAVQLAAAALLAVSVRPPARGGAALPWCVAALLVVLCTVTAVVPSALLPAVAGAGSGAGSGVPVALVWAGAAVGLAVRGPRRPLVPGLAVVAAAELTATAAGPVPAAVRLAGVVLVLAALVRVAVRALADVRAQQWAQQEELALAAVHGEHVRELAAERDHELRNGLAGLAGVTHLLSSDADPREQQRLRLAVLAELTRLHSILDRDVLDGGMPDGDAVAADDPAGAAHPDYAVEPVLAGLVTLRRSTGTAIDLVVDGPLRARGDAAVLAQVVTNLLANCERHAPRARVRVSAHRAGGQVVVQVRDEGPGLWSVPGRDLRERGVRDPAAGGSGLGLHVSARLVAREGGELDLRTVDDPLGCLATVRLPAAAVPDRAVVPEGARPEPAPSRRSGGPAAEASSTGGHGGVASGRAGTRRGA